MEHSIAILLGAFQSGLTQLRREVEQYGSDEELWRVPPGISNSGGTLALHQVYSLAYLVGAVLGGAPREWNRDEAFTRRGLGRVEVLAEIDACAEPVRGALQSLDEEALRQPYPESRVSAEPISTGTFLVHLAMHTAYHNGQLNYHRRLVSQREGQA